MKTKEFAKLVLSRCNEPLSYKQIWEKGVEFGLDKDLEYLGATPIQITIHSLLDQEINTHGEKSLFIRMSGSPVLYGLREKAALYAENEAAVEEAYEKAIESESKEDEEKDKSGEYRECDLHPVLVKYLINDGHFSCRTRTIVQQEGEQSPKGTDKWRYPDLIGVYDVKKTGDFADCTLDLMKKLEVNTVKVFSFEMKKTITLSTAREYYFQTVSNSSWANEGYLVAASIDEDDKDLLKELSLLNNLFGIGVIKLNIKTPRESRILFPAREKDVIDFASLNVLINRSGANGAARQVFEYVSGRSYGNTFDDVFDEVLEDEEYDRKTNHGENILGIAGRKK